jgi:ketosteroid isomerase-like protein
MTALETVNHFYQAIMDKNASKICSFYVQDEQTYVVLEGPRLTTLGFSKIEKGWIDFCASGLTLDGIEWLEGAFSEETTDMAWVGGVIRLKVSVNQQSFEQTFRASFVLRKNIDTNVSNTEGSRWLIRHEHVSGALTDPYGIGDWLKK